MASLSLGQQQALAIIPKVTGVLSVLLSSLTAFVIYRDPSKRSKVYHRLILGMSLADISSSLWLSLSTWPIPADNNNNTLWAVGTTATCTVQGFFTQFGISSPLYNTSLALYYVLAIRYGWKEAQLHSMEKWLHAMPVGWALATAIAGLPLEIFNSANLWCWIANDPAGVRNTSTDVYRWTFFYGPLWSAIVFVTASLVVVFAYVRSVTLRSERYSVCTIFQQQQQQSPLGIANIQTIQDQNSLALRSEEIHDNDDNGATIENASEEKVEEYSLHLERASRYGNIPPDGRDMNNLRSSLRFSRRFKSLAGGGGGGSSKPPIETRQFALRRREVAFQCLRYALAFYWTWIPISLVRIYQTAGVRPNYTLFFLAAMNTPFQGLPNCLVYLYPLYQKARKANPTSNFVKVARLSLARDNCLLPSESGSTGSNNDATS